MTTITTLLASGVTDAVMSSWIKVAAVQGGVLPLFIGLLIYVLKTTAKREKEAAERERRNQEHIEKLVKALADHDKVISDISEIRTYLFSQK